jgi:hypothetical protein
MQTQAVSRKSQTFLAAVARIPPRVAGLVHGDADRRLP